MTDTAAMPDLSPYLRTQHGAHGFGPRRSAGGPRLRHQRAQRRNLITAPAARKQLDSMTDALLPLTAALLPYGVKKL